MNKPSLGLPLGSVRSNGWEKVITHLHLVLPKLLNPPMAKRQSWVQIPPLPFPSCVDLESYLSSLCPSFLICKRGVVFF